MSRRVHEIETMRLVETLESVRTELVATAGREDYWRRKAEKLIDASLSRAGAIHEPTMVETPKRDMPATAFLAGMSIQEIPRELAEQIQ